VQENFVFSEIVRDRWNTIMKHAGSSESVTRIGMARAHTNKGITMMPFPETVRDRWTLAMENDWEVLVAISQSFMRFCRGLTLADMMTSFPVFKKTSFSRKQCVTDERLPWNRNRTRVHPSRIRCWNLYRVHSSAQMTMTSFLVCKKTSFSWKPCETD